MRSAGAVSQPPQSREQRPREQRLCEMDVERFGTVSRAVLDGIQRNNMRQKGPGVAFLTHIVSLNSAQYSSSYSTATLGIQFETLCSL